MGTPSVAVVVTNHNYGRFVAAAVDSVLAQTAACRLVVVDDGSTDDSAEVLDRLAAANPAVTVLTRPNGGQGAAMNTGWTHLNSGEEQRPDIVLFLDGDDTLEPTAVAEVQKAWSTEPDVVRCQFRLQWVDADGEVIEGSFPEPDRALPVGDLRARVCRAPDDIPWQPTSGNAFGATFLAQVMPIPESDYRISADHYLSNLSAVYGTVLGVEEHLGHYRVHGSNEDHRARFDLDRVRSILVRTEATRGHLIDHGRLVGLDDMPQTTDGFRSLTTSAMRLASKRLGASVGIGPDPHPFPDDRRFALLAKAVTAARNRSDLTAARRLQAVAWVLALGLAPRFLVRRIAAAGLTR